MDDYIKRSYALKAVCDYCVMNCDVDEEKCHQYDFMQNNIPAADVRENVRGKWKNTVAFHIECSECGCNISANKGIVFFTHDSKYNFCPNCGADMRGNEE